MDTTLADPLVGRVLEGRYRIDGRIARGGMATVYRGLDVRLDRVVAIKVMHPGLADDADFLARFTREAKAAARLSSPHVVGVFDQGSHDGLAFLVMELVPGRTLRDLIAERGRLSPAQALSVLEPVLLALAAAHRAGLVHRDVKPENVLLGDDGTVKVADFGLARAVEAASHTVTRGLLIGTVAYLAPEQVTAGSADERTDVYAAGVLLFEMLTGAVPYAGDTAFSVAYRHVHEDMPPPSSRADVPPALDALTVRATRRAPASRPADAGAFLTELRHVRESLGLRTVPVPVSSRAAALSHRTIAVPVADTWNEDARNEPVRRRRWLPLVLALVALLGVLTAGAGWWLGAGRWTTTPSLTGLTRPQAEAQAETAGLSVALAPAAYSEVVPVNSVIGQDPGAADRILKGGTVTLVVSQGKERHRIPDVRGKTDAQAQSALKQAKCIAQVTRRYDEKVPAGRVVAESPAPGLSVRPATMVSLAVSRGPAPVAVPGVVGANVDDAKTRLSALGLKATVAMAFNDTVAADDVIAQTPTSGRVARGSTVALTVSKGPPPVTVPDVTGQPVAQARRQLEAAGFTVRIVTFLFGDNVLKQSPGGGKTAPKGSTVNLLR